ncbi:hypothetical protein R3P38DRAFT_3179142 [Favolaschia claudopus]|uniref:Uncharacterized protein n=1 Tax=Favolaschia claudopus TaxID=2862362 RepID=A0AAW0CUM2_9AGAR
MLAVLQANLVSTTSSFDFVPPRLTVAFSLKSNHSPRHIPAANLKWLVTASSRNILTPALAYRPTDFDLVANESAYSEGRNEDEGLSTQKDIHTHRLCLHTDIAADARYDPPTPPSLSPANLIPPSPARTRLQRRDERLHLKTPVLPAPPIHRSPAHAAAGLSPRSPMYYKQLHNVLSNPSVSADLAPSSPSPPSSLTRRRRPAPHDINAVATNGKQISTNNQMLDPALPTRASALLALPTQPPPPPTREPNLRETRSAVPARSPVERSCKAVSPKIQVSKGLFLNASRRYLDTS